MNNFKSDKLRDDIFEKLGLSQRLSVLIEENKVERFSEDLWNKIKYTNIGLIRDFLMIFEQGYNIGTCGICSRYLSFSFSDFSLVEYGICRILIGTEGASIGQHAWLEEGGFVYDTTLLLKISKDIAYNEFGYAKERVTDSSTLMEDPIYLVQKDIAEDIEDLKEKWAYRDKLARLGLKCSNLGLF